MTPPAALEFAAQTDTGLVRSHNEDSIAISTECGLAIIADGMGGYNAGEVASGIATSVLKELLEIRLLSPQVMETIDDQSIRDLVVESIAHANASIIAAARAELQYSGMGTTLVAALFHKDNIVTVAHIGDSRAYRLRHDAIEQITRDHSLVQEQIDAGLVSEEDARFAPNRNLITRAMGVDQDVEVEIHQHATEPGDIYLLCSDGLSDMLSAHDMLNLVTRAHHSLPAACEALVQRANEEGGRDNISVVLIRVPATTPPAGLFGRLVSWIK
ncbi:MAG: Stp1/IreP family PP2C-type Ser/Thr phosphatase [Pseudomonadota bacterium]